MTVNRSLALSTRPLDRRSLLISTAALGLGASAFPIISPIRRASASQATPAATAAPPAGAVYAMTNGDGVGNAIVGFTRDDAGLLTYLATTPTGGEGTGRRNVPSLDIENGFDTLMSNHALVYDAERRLLFAVNAADGTVSSLAIADDYSLTTVSTVAAGTFPTSLAHHGDRVVVALSGNPLAGEPTSLISLRVGDDGALSVIDGSATVLSDAEMTKPTDVVFTADGAHVIVTDTMTNLLSVFPIGDDGLVGAVVATTSAGVGPFGTARLGDNRLVVTETQGGPTMGGFGKSSISIYAIGDDGSLTTLADQVSTTRTAACWVAVTPDGRQAITANTGDGTISTFAIADDGSATLESAVAAQQVTTVGRGSGAIDSAISPDGAFYYQLWGGLGVVQGYAIGPDGSLAPIDGGIGGGLPQLGSQGIVVI